MFVMKLSTLLVFVIIFGILLWDFQSAQGIKCYSCENCNGKGEETECIVRFPGFPTDFPSFPPGFPTPPPGFPAPPPGFPDPPPGFPAPPPGIITGWKLDRCLKQETKSGVIKKSCSNEIEDSWAKSKNYKCDDFGNLDSKVCFCTTDLCNEAPSFTGYSKRQLLFTCVATLSAYFVVHVLF